LNPEAELVISGEVAGPVTFFGGETGEAGETGAEAAGWTVMVL
jgi:hypothetical protein